jgi:hypothetical protein
VTVAVAALLAGTVLPAVRAAGATAVAPGAPVRPVVDAAGGVGVALAAARAAAETVGGGATAVAVAWPLWAPTAGTCTAGTKARLNAERCWASGSLTQASQLLTPAPAT